MISIVTTCVNYLDFLRVAYEYNKEIFNQNNYWIVTSNEDIDTQNFCKKNGIQVFSTDSFYINDAKFNKAEAINDFFRKKSEEIFENDWILLCDADIVAAPAVKYVSENIANMNTKCLYSVGRKICLTRNDFITKKTKYEGCNFIGYFQLFHKENIKPHFDSYGWFLPIYDNCSGYDIDFKNRFKCYEEIKGLPALHIGEPCVNWHGRKSEEW